MLNNQRVCFIFFKHGFRLRRVFGTRMVAISPSTHAAPSNCWSFRFFVHLQGGPTPPEPCSIFHRLLSYQTALGLDCHMAPKCRDLHGLNPSRDQKALRSCKITQVLRKSSPQSVAFFRSAGFGVSFQLSTNQTQ